MPVINNVTFLFAKLAKPVKTYDETGTEFSIDAVLSKADWKALKKELPKAKAKEYDNEEFSAKFNIEVPFPDQDEQYVVKFKRAHTRKDGTVTPAEYFPRVFKKDEKGVAKDITYTVSVGNGSKGKLEYSTFTSKGFEGTFIQISSILVEDLIEYKAKGGEPVGSAFGATELAEAPKYETPTKAQEPKAPEGEGDLESDCPF